MRYVGNTALSPQIQERIQNTFQQTLGLAEEGNRQEALLGCDFILRLDPLFEPARRLQERLNEGDGPVDINGLTGSPAEEEPSPVVPPPTQVQPEEPALEAPVAPSPTQVQPEEADLEAPAQPILEASVDIGELIADAPDEPALVNDPPVPAAPIEISTEEEPAIAAKPTDEMSVAVEPPPEAVEIADAASIDEADFVLETEDMLATGDALDTEGAFESEVAAAGTAELPTRMAMLLEQRSFQDLMALAMESQDQINADPELQRIVGVATERLEAEPYVRNFLESSHKAKDKGDLDGAKSHLEKARELDPSHPDLSALEADLEAASRVEPPASFEPPPMPEVPLEETPPLLEPEPAEEIGSEVDEFFAAVESIAEEAPASDTPAEGSATVASEPEPAPAPAIDEPQIVPTLDAEPAARLDSESEQRIDDLLREGQESFEDGQYQTAIDAWSRIFLIDIDHAEASRRIELARKLKAEVERQTEEAFHEGITRLESGDQEKATAAFNKVLEMQPNHMGARDYLDKIESGDLTAKRTEAPDLTPVDQTPAPSETPIPDLGDLEDSIPGSPTEATELDDLPIAEPMLEQEMPPAPRKRSFVLIGSAVLLLLLGVGWFVYSNWDRFFPASGPDEAATAAPAQADPIERARELHEAGNTAMAINVLRRLPPSNEKYAEALALIASWEASSQPAQPFSDQPSEELLAQRDELLAQAERALARGQHLQVLDLLDEAHEIMELGDEHILLKDQATVALEFLREERDLFDQGDWEYALPNLWRMHENNPDNPDVVRLMIDSYYNLGLRDLQRGDADSALEKFEEAQTLTEADPEIERLAEFAAAYSERSSDMLYRIFVKYQRFR